MLWLIEQPDTSDVLVFENQFRNPSAVDRGDFASGQAENTGRRFFLLDSFSLLDRFAQRDALRRDPCRPGGCRGGKGRCLSKMLSAEFMRRL